MAVNLSQPELSEQVVSACRTALGDHLRTIVLYTKEDFEVTYMREDIRTPERTIEERFIMNERLGFGSRETYNTLARRPETEPAIGEYLFTVRAFSEGYVSRVIVDDVGVLLITDSMQMDAFEELSVTLRTILSDFQ